MPGRLNNLTPAWTKILREKYNTYKGEHPWVQAVEDRVFGNPYNENGDLKYYAGTTLFDLLSPAGAAKLAETGKTLQETERAARAVKEAQSAKEAAMVRDAAEVTINQRTGRTHIRPKQKGSGTYVKTASSSMEAVPTETSAAERTIASPKTAKDIMAQDPNAYVNANLSAQQAASMGLDDLAQSFYKDAAWLNPQKDSPAARYLWGGLYKNGGILSGKSGIHIKPENKGKFSRSAKAAGEGVQEHAHHVMNDPNATTLQKRRANFAIQAARWSKKKKKHENGGKINWWVWAKNQTE